METYRRDASLQEPDAPAVRLYKPGGGTPPLQKQKPADHRSPLHKKYIRKAYDSSYRKAEPQSARVCVTSLWTE
jgi:hypothetical protein